MQPEEIHEGELSDTDQKRGSNKNDDITEEVMPARSFTLKEPKGRFHDAECTEEKMLEADQNFERSMTIGQSTEKILPLYLKLYKEEASTVLLLISFS